MSNKYPAGWDEARIKDTLDYYESRTDEEAAAEDEAAFKDPRYTMFLVPVALAPAVRALLARYEESHG